MVVNDEVTFLVVDDEPDEVTELLETVVEAGMAPVLMNDYESAEEFLEHNAVAGFSFDCRLKRRSGNIDRRASLEIVQFLSSERGELNRRSQFAFVTNYDELVGDAVENAAAELPGYAGVMPKDPFQSCRKWIVGLGMEKAGPRAATVRLATGEALAAAIGRGEGIDYESWLTEVPMVAAGYGRTPSEALGQLTFRVEAQLDTLRRTPEDQAIPATELLLRAFGDVAD